MIHFIIKLSLCVNILHESSFCPKQIFQAKVSLFVLYVGNQRSFELRISALILFIYCIGMGQ